MTLIDVKSQLDAIIKNGKLLLNREEIYAEIITRLIEKLPWQRFEICDVQISLTDNETSSELSIKGILCGSWKIAEIDDSIIHFTHITLTIKEYEDGELDIAFEVGAEIGDFKITLTSELSEFLVLTGTITGINLSTIARNFLPLVSFPEDFPDLEFTDLNVSITPKTGEFSLSGKSAQSWIVPLGVGGLEIKEVTLNMNRAKQPDGTKVDSGVISGIVQIAGSKLTINYEFPGNFVFNGTFPAFSMVSLSPLVQSLCGTEAIRDLPVPISVQALQFSDLAMSIDPNKKNFTFSGQSIFGQSEISIQKVGTGWGFCMGLLPPDTWKFSQIASELAVLDAIRFSDTVLIVSSFNDGLNSTALPAVQSLRQDVALVKGLNFFSQMDLSQVYLNKILDIDSLNIYAAIGRRPSDLTLETAINGEFDLTEGVVFGDIVFRIKPAPKDFSLTLLCAVNAMIGKDSLKFIGGLQILQRAAVFKATMKGTWNEPFGTKGVTVTDVALDMGLSLPSPIPTIGIAGALKIGDFMGAVAIKFDSNMPSKSMIAVAFNKLYLIDIIKAFCEPKIFNAIPQQVRDTVLDIGMEEAKVYIVPQPTTIGIIQFDQGFTIQGRLLLWGLKAFAYLNLDYVNGIQVYGEVDPINLAGIFKLNGTGGKDKAALDLKVMPGKVPALKVTGAIEILNIRSDADIILSKNGFYFKINGNLFNKFKCSLEVKGGNLASVDDFYIIASMSNDLFDYMKKSAIEFISNETKKAVDSINRAQQALNSGQLKVNSLLAEIEKMKGLIALEKKTAQQKLQDAQNAVGRAQGEVNRIQGQINSVRDTINYHQRMIDDKWRWYNNSAWYEKIYRWAELSAECLWRGAAISSLYATIGALETAKWTAIGVLEIAKLTLRTIENVMNFIPIESDPRILALYTAYGTATVSLMAANQALELTKKTLGATAELAKAMVTIASGGIIDVRSARFEGRINALKGGRVTMSIVVSFLNRSPQSYLIDFNFYNPLDGAYSLAKKLLPS